MKGQGRTRDGKGKGDGIKREDKDRKCKEVNRKRSRTTERKGQCLLTFFSSSTAHMRSGVRKT